MARDNGFNLLGSRGGGKVENRGNSLALAHNAAKKFMKLFEKFYTHEMLGTSRPFQSEQIIRIDMCLHAAAQKNNLNRQGKTIHEQIRPLKVHLNKNF